ncbi:uncharacterized protein MYCGRDRAFT_106324 [Zymoseptoria tritici IPO323]|uniref:Uncharacterized protein n=1 Tax=Zymoseptoria tritici (strain CBS 115943 / IPO323) TaxID=336722 RepID=F9XNL2_ZYMTI|nr:uncharacterized protein MYCGRDRAFT_106324 [Zymoseptoria tritici IPO323]EGP82892.1 hypothetical protein MYCGRDRAFT_106324 [Zymoseptoria tritici IPO323]
MDSSNSRCSIADELNAKQPESHGIDGPLPFGASAGIENWEPSTKFHVPPRHVTIEL